MTPKYHQQTLGYKSHYPWHLMTSMQHLQEEKKKNIKHLTHKKLLTQKINKKVEI